MLLRQKGLLFKRASGHALPAPSMTSHITRLSSLQERAHCQHAIGMALHTYDCCVFPQLDWDWDWEMHTPGGAGDTQAIAQQATFFPATRAGSPVSSEASSGYLQNAVAHWGDRCNKRQRMAATPPPRRPAAVSEDLQCLLESFWDCTAEGRDLSHDLITTVPEMETICSFVSGEDGANASGKEEQRGPSAQVAAAAQGGEEVVPPPGFATAVRAATAGAPHAAARRDDRLRPVDCCEPSRAGAGAASTATTMPGASCPSRLAGREKPVVGVLYPFAVVKPLGLDDGCMTTLSDVNQRMLKRPARPVRHPVGAFACCPAVSAHGLGLSGKAVVSLTRIRTGGKGTITIIGTRG